MGPLLESVVRGENVSRTGLVSRAVVSSRTYRHIARHHAAAYGHSQSNSRDIKSSYDGSNVVYRLLRMETWGPTLMNLGYYRFPPPFVLLNMFTNHELAQRRLVTNSIKLVGLQNGHQLLDVACGRGKSSFIAQCMFPQATVTGVDLLQKQIQVAQTIFDRVPNLSYISGDAMSLNFADESFDRVMCLEAAFHFPDRTQFLREACRVLRPGGRMIVVDFAWNTDSDRARADDPETEIVRQVWQWDDLFSIPEYGREASAAGFRVVCSQNWSHRVTQPIQGLFRFLAMVGNTDWTRRLLMRRNPLYRSFSVEDWRQVAHAARAHTHVGRYAQYMAFVLEKC